MSKLESWGRYPYKPQNSSKIYWQDGIADNLKKASQENKTTLAYGNGRSYGDVCLAKSDHVLQMRGLSKFLDFDAKNGIIKVEAGVTLEEILNVIIPKGWFLSVTPGTKYATVGGAVANDVHGKNHHLKGSFGCSVLSLSLVRSDEGEIICSQNQNPELFSATIGGLGLTGIISFVELKLIRIKSSSIKTKIITFKSLDEFFEIAKENDEKYEYTVSWIDCLSRGKNLGRGIYFAGNHDDGDGKNDLKISQKKKIAIPFAPPFSLINKLSLNIFNRLYYYLHSRKDEERSDYDKFFYPLDNIKNWNRIYGKNGFQQYQCVIPKESAKEGMKEILQIIADSGSGSFLAVLKNFGNIKSPGLLSFPIEGVTLALDFAQKKYLQDLFAKLDEIVVKFNGRIYPAKDAHMSAKDFKKFYPNWQELEKLRDKSLNSHFWDRVTKE